MQQFCFQVGLRQGKLKSWWLRHTTTTTTTFPLSHKCMTTTSSMVWLRLVNSTKTPQIYMMASTFYKVTLLEVFQFCMYK